MAFQGGLLHSLCWSQWRKQDALPAVYLQPSVQRWPAGLAEFLQVQKVRLFLLCGVVNSNRGIGIELLSGCVPVVIGDVRGVLCAVSAADATLFSCALSSAVSSVVTC